MTRLCSAGRTRDLLLQFGVDLVQGYHLDRPAADHPSLQGKSQVRV
jgi:EAL domain-containing protein (putative c-di-GMP-specific phosphodiesterase class I)